MKKKFDLTLLSKHWLLKVLSLVIGISLWYFVVGEDQVDMIVTIPLELHNLPAELIIANQYKKDIEVTIRGPRRMIQELRQQNISRPVDLSGAEPGPMVFENDSESIPLPRGITVQRVQPANITLLVDQLVKKDFAITPLTEGKPADGFLFDSITLNPPHITVTGPQTVLREVSALQTYVINIEGLDHSSTVQVHLNLDEPLLKLIGETVIEAKINLKESMVKKTVRSIPVNVKDSDQAVRTVPSMVTVEAEIPEPIVRITPELSMLFRAAVSLASKKDNPDVAVTVTGVNLPGHAPIVILKTIPDKVRIIQ